MAAGRRRLGLLSAALLVLGLLAPIRLAAPASAACPDVFSSTFRQELSQHYPGQRVTASVHDTRTGCWYDLAPGTLMQTASVIKAQFLAGLLVRAQDHHRGLSAWERERIAPMMSVSHNPPASELFLDLGGVAGQERLDERFGLVATTSTSKWGATVSTARDRTTLALALLHGGGPLGAAARDEAWRTMTSVHPTQTWGITAGVPAGWTTALKNGFYPTTGAPRWRIGSTGFVRHDATGQGYAVTIMSDQNPDHETGQRLVEMVSRRIASVLTGAPGAIRAVDRSRCVAARSGESWSGVAARLGTSDVAGVRYVSGGPTNPLGGMRACRPDLSPPPYDPAGPNARYVRALHQTFLSRAASDSETRHHATRLDAGIASRFDVAHELATSAEWLDRAIDDIYRVALDRAPDPAGRAHWRWSVASGLPLSEVGVHVFAGDEFFHRSGGTAGGVVDELYRRLLHRPSDSEGRRYWLDELERGVTRTEVARSFYRSIESRRDRVERTYRGVLGRGPDTAGHAYWADQLLRHDDVHLASHLAVSDEYFSRAQRG